MTGFLALDEGAVRWVWDLLRQTYGDLSREPSNDPLGELVATILSQHTSDTNSGRAYETLRQTFSSWEAVRDAPEQAVADAIRAGGLASIKARRIQNILRELSTRESSGLAKLPAFENMEVSEALAFLQSLNGVGPKTAACVLLFALHRPVFPVDTHVLRVTTRLGWLAEHTNAEAAFDILDESVPGELKLSLHLLLIRHGRDVCHSQRPACPTCQIRSRCRYFRQLSIRTSE